MAKDHRPKPPLDYTYTKEGTFECMGPPTGNPTPNAASRYLGIRRPKESWTPEDERKWKAYWEKNDSEFAAWEMHYKRKKWNIGADLHG